MKRRLILSLAALLLSTGMSANAASPNPRVKMTTSMGVMIIELDQKKAPVTVKNFLGYVRSGHYNGTLFHRVIPGFMIQGGGMTPGMNEKSTRAPIKNEAANGLRNLTGTIAMARTNDPHSASAQFFINVNDNTGLDHDRAQRSLSGMQLLQRGNRLSILPLTKKEWDTILKLAR